MSPLQNLPFKPKNSCKYFYCAKKDKENENSDFISSSESHFLTKEEPGQRKRNLTLKENSGKYKMDKHFPRTVEYTAVQCTVPNQAPNHMNRQHACTSTVKCEYQNG